MVSGTLKKDSTHYDARVTKILGQKDEGNVVNCKNEHTSGQIQKTILRFTT